MPAIWYLRPHLWRGLDSMQCRKSGMIRAVQAKGTVIRRRAPKASSLQVPGPKILDMGTGCELDHDRANGLRRTMNGLGISSRSGSQTATPPSKGGAPRFAAEACSLNARFGLQLTAEAG